MRISTELVMDYVFEASSEVFAQRDELRGMRFTHAPKVLRHFTAQFKEI